MRTRTILHVLYRGRWIGRGSQVSWPARYLDLTFLDLNLKNVVYERKDKGQYEGSCSKSLCRYFAKCLAANNEKFSSRVEWTCGENFV